MQVAYVGNFEPEWSTENDVRLAFEHLGWDVVQLQENQADEAVIRQVALASHLLLWTGTWDWFQGPNYSDGAQPLAPSLETFGLLAKAGIPSATLHLDTFWKTARQGRRWWLHPMFHTGYVFTADGDHAEDWSRLGVRHYWLPPAVRHTVPDEVGRSMVRYDCDVAFVGSDGRGYHEEWPYRRELVDWLEKFCADQGLLFSNPGGRHPKVERQHMTDFYASARVVVGDSLCPLKEHSRYWSDRVYEACGRGARMIFPQVDMLNTMRELNGHLPMYSWGDFDCLGEMILAGLRTPDAFTQTAELCREDVRDRHTYVHRVQKMLRAMDLM